MSAGVHWLVAVSITLGLVACGGSDEEQKASSVAGYKDGVSSVGVGGANESAQPEGAGDASAFNSVDALFHADATPAQEGAAPFAEVPVSVHAAAPGGVDVDLGEPPPAALEMQRKHNASRSEPRRSKSLLTKAHQIGFSRPLPVADEMGSAVQAPMWQPTSDGRLTASWRIGSTGAQAIRVGLHIRQLSDGAVVRVRAADEQSALQTTGQHINQAIQANIKADGESADARTYWMPSVQGGAVVLEVELPTGSGVADADLTVPAIVHMTETAAQAQAAQIQAKSACPAFTPDATCTLSPVANAVAALEFVKNGIGGYTCTGTLLANRGPDAGPGQGPVQQGYLLTANHCIANQTEASSLATIWFWRSATCNGNVVNPGTVPLFGGATLRYTKTEVSSYTRRNNQDVVTDAGTDTTLLDLPYTPPAGAMYAGWTAHQQQINNGIDYVSLHQPDGNWLRRSTGRIGHNGIYTYDGFFYRGSDPAFPFYQVSWSDGITEMGSSGAGLFLGADTSNPQLVGQLWGGLSSCSSRYEPDYYGRFDLAYQEGLVEWLNPGYRPVFRFFVSGAGVHFYSADVSERNNVRQNIPSFSYEGVSYMVASNGDNGATPVYRFYRPSAGVHFYTNDEAEKNAVLLNPSYRFEGISWYASSAPQADTTPIFRFFRPGTGTHLYTADVQERDNIIASMPEFTYEGVAYYAWPYR